MSRTRPAEEWVSRLGGRNRDEAELAREALGEALCADDAAQRERTAQVLLETLARPGGTGHAAILNLLMSSWWPPQPGLAGAAVDAVLAALQRMEVEAPEVNDAATVLANVCRVAPDQLSALGPALSHAHPAVRRAAAGAVGRVGPAAMSLLAPLLTCLDGEEAVAGAALESLGSLASLAPAIAAPVLLAEVGRSEGARRFLALVSLRGLMEELRRGWSTPPALAGWEEVLLRTLQEAEPTARREAVALLGLGGPLSSEARATLTRQLQDESADVAAHAAVALLRLGAPFDEALSALAGWFAASDPAREDAALAAMDGLEPATLARARPVLEEAARTAGAATRAAVRELLAQLA